MQAAENARVASSLMWTTTRLCVLFRGWSEHSKDPAAAVWLYRASRHLWDHAQRFAAIRPESLLLEGSSAQGAECRPPDARSAARLAALQSSGDLSRRAGGQDAQDDTHDMAPEPVAIAGALIERLEAQAAQRRESCDPQVDGALRRTLDMLMIDLSAARADRPGSGTDIEIDFLLIAPVG